MIEKLLQQKEYEYNPIPKSFNQNFEALNDYGGISTVFDDLTNKLNRIPTHDEYVNEGVARATLFFTQSEYHYVPKYNCRIKFEWNEDLQNAVKYRLSRTYPSYIIEEQVKEYLEAYPEVRIKTSKHLDLTFGVDLVILYQEKQLYYLHIAANSRFTKRLIKDKGTRSCYIKHNNKKHYWTRNWGPAHSLLLYNTTLTDRMTLINNNLVFNQDYLDKHFNNLFTTGMFELDDNQSELYQFYTFLTNICQPN